MYIYLYIYIHIYIYTYRGVFAKYSPITSESSSAPVDSRLRRCERTLTATGIRARGQEVIAQTPTGNLDKFQKMISK